MADVTVTTQIAPVAANAGLTQNISVSTPAGSSGVLQGQSGPGWATPSGGSSTIAPASGTTASVTLSASNWPIYLVVAALGWFAYKKLGG